MSRTFELFDMQLAFVNAPERFTAFGGGIGSGKTYAGTVKSIGAIGEIGGLGLVVAPTYPMLRDATERTFLDLAGELVLDFNKSEHRATFKNGAEAIFRSSEHPERLRGPNLSWAWLDEAALMDGLSWKIVIGRLRAGGKAGPAWVTTTPKGRNWVYHEFKELDRPGKYCLFRARTQDNRFLDPEFVRDLEDSYTGDFARQELVGEFVSFEGLIYDEFRRDVHIWRGPLPELRDIAIGVDEGYTNPSILLAIGFDSDGRAYVVDEFYERRVLHTRVVEEAGTMSGRWNAKGFYCDPSAAELSAALIKAHLRAFETDHEVLSGIRSVKARLKVQDDGRPRLYVTPGCVNTIAEFESYCWKKTKGEFKEEPEKVNDHAMDALRYVIYPKDKRGTPRLNEPELTKADRMVTAGLMEERF